MKNFYYYYNYYRRTPKAQCPSRNISLHFKHFFLPETPLSVWCDEDNSIIGAPEVFGRNSSGCLMWWGYRHSPGLAGSISSRPSFHLRAFLEKCKRFLSKLQNVFVQIAKYICLNWSMHLFKLQKKCHSAGLPGWYQEGRVFICGHFWKSLYQWILSFEQLHIIGIKYRTPHFGKLQLSNPWPKCCSLRECTVQASPNTPW